MTLKEIFSLVDSATLINPDIQLVYKILVEGNVPKKKKDEIIKKVMKFGVSEVLVKKNVKSLSFTIVTTNGSSYNVLVSLNS